MFHCRRSCVDWSSSSNLGASTLTPIRTRCLQQGVVTLVSKNQISPDSLPSYIRELAPEPTRGKKKGKSITDYHRRASTEFQTLSPYLQLLTNKQTTYSETSKVCNIILPELVTYITSPPP